MGRSAHPDMITITHCMVMSNLTNSAIFQQIPSLTILLHPTNIEFVVCIDQSSQQDFAVDGTSTEESTSYTISILTQFRPEWLGIWNNHSDKLLGNLLLSLVEVHNNIGGLHDNVHRTIKCIFSALLLMFILRRYTNIFYRSRPRDKS